ncbi:hypothetical protein HDU96_009010 [Phlyctochytrium bullatum]|nr:hypothetical protein HDU96_009010 [Phlyctochytrium bullatum]
MDSPESTPVSPSTPPSSSPPPPPSGIDDAPRQRFIFGWPWTHPPIRTSSTTSTPTTAASPTSRTTYVGNLESAAAQPAPPTSLNGLITLVNTLPSEPIPSPRPAQQEMLPFRPPNSVPPPVGTAPQPSPPASTIPVAAASTIPIGTLEALPTALPNINIAQPLPSEGSAAAAGQAVEAAPIVVPASPSPAPPPPPPRPANPVTAVVAVTRPVESAAPLPNDVIIGPVNRPAPASTPAAPGQLAPAGQTQPATPTTDPSFQFLAPLDPASARNPFTPLTLVPLDAPFATADTSPGGSNPAPGAAQIPLESGFPGSSRTVSFLPGPAISPAAPGVGVQPNGIPATSFASTLVVAASNPTSSSPTPSQQGPTAAIVGVSVAAAFIAAWLLVAGIAYTVARNRRRRAGADGRYGVREFWADVWGGASGAEMFQAKEGKGAADLEAGVVVAPKPPPVRDDDSPATVVLYPPDPKHPKLKKPTPVIADVSHAEPPSPRVLVEASTMPATYRGPTLVLPIVTSSADAKIAIAAPEEEQEEVVGGSPVKEKEGLVLPEVPEGQVETLWKDTKGKAKW